MIRRRQHPRLAWLIEHLTDLYLLAVLTPIAAAALFLHFV